MLVWDNLRTFIDAHDWLTAFRLPAYAPELNPAEGVWANLKGKLVNLAPRGLDQLTVLVKSHLKRMQYRPALLDGFVAQAGLALEPP
ncbi:transposase [Sphaerimonospora mesophila]|uniref:transposase n=1 Tax=Sphaerimonospora mesophila TaxID=37483 RepID=UPI000ABC77E0